MKRSTFETVLSFLLGFAWALLFLGSLLVFKITVYFSVPLAILATLVFIFWALFCILLLEGLHLYKERNELAKEQVRLLKRIAGKLDDKA